MKNFIAADDRLHVTYVLPDYAETAGVWQCRPDMLAYHTLRKLADLTEVPEQKRGTLLIVTMQGRKPSAMLADAETIGTKADWNIAYMEAPANAPTQRLYESMKTGSITTVKFDELDLLIAAASRFAEDKQQHEVTGRLDDFTHSHEWLRAVGQTLRQPNSRTHYLYHARFGDVKLDIVSSPNADELEVTTNIFIGKRSYSYRRIVSGRELADASYQTPNAVPVTHGGIMTGKPSFPWK